ncbi:MAG TPA: Ig-like domain-containing protein, partial [Candidatus Binatia bacterium]|nr:Ig-like domain-containing protein [Candidatus Binatia bacterium]
MPKANPWAIPGLKHFLPFFLLVFGVLRTEAQVVFSDDFSRTNDPAPLAPWIQSSNTWLITGGALESDSTSLNTFSFAYITNSWSNYSVQARVRFSSTNADMGGIGGRLNPFSGGHYAAWIAPEGSPDGPRTLQLVKFQFWFAYEYTNTTGRAMQKVTLPSVGTNWHTLQLAFQGNQITVSYDSNQVISVTDTESNPFLSGGIIAGMSTAATPFSLFVDDVSVSLLPPVLTAANDLYYVTRNGSLTIPAPGVLKNDTAGPRTNLTAAKLTNPAKGTLTFNSNGGFTYVPSNNFVGIDSFTYRANDGLSNSAPATAVIDVTPPGTNIFFDNFTRSAGVNPYAPWVVGLGEWNISGGVLLGSGTYTNYYSDTYVPTMVGDFTIQDKFQLPAGAWACGLSGRVNPITGERYVANVYPEGSPLGPTPALRLIKFHSWATWSPTFTAMALVSLPPVGTTAHTLKMAFYGNQIDVYFDGNLVVHAVDDNVDGLPFYRSGYFGAHMYMFSRYQATFDDLSVISLPGVNFPPVLPAQGNRIIVPLTTLVVTNTATDSDIPTNTLAYSLLTAPAGASIDTNGIITWTPTQAQDLSTNLFTTVVTDSFPTATNAQHLSATNSFTVFVSSRAVISLDSSAFLAESCTPTNNALDPGETVTMLFSLRDTGLINATNLVATLLPGNGVTSPSGSQSYGALVAGGASVPQPFTFTATGVCGSTVTANFQLQDGSANLGTLAVPLLLGSLTPMWNQSFDTVTAPALPSGWSTSATGAQTNWVTQSSVSSTPPNAAFVPDVLNIGLSDLVSPVVVLPPGPAHLSFANNYDLETNNAIEAFDGAVLEIKIGTNAFADILAAGGSFITNGYTHTISTNFGNPLGGRAAWSGTSPGFIPTVVNLPAAAGGQNIQLRWRCGTDNSNGRTGWYVDSISLSSPACCATISPILPAQIDRTIPVLTTLVVTNTATDASMPPSDLTYSLLNPPSGATIDTNGIIRWTPTKAQGPSTNLITTAVTDTNVPPLGQTNSFTVTVLESNSPPVLPIQTNRTLVGLAMLVVTNTATDSDIPTETLTYVLQTGPTNAAINTNGVITWTPVVTQVPSTNIFTTVVTDYNPWAFNAQHLSATNSFTVVVNAIHNGPSLPAQTNRTVVELSMFALTNTATDADVPPRALTYALLAPPSGATIDANGVITWTPTEAQGPGTNLITTVVSDDGTPLLSATNSFSVTVLESNSPPVLPAQTNRTLVGMAMLVVTNTASDSDIPTNTLTYVLQTGPTNAAIDTNGVITWTPVVAQVPSTNVFTTVVTDYNPWAFNAQHLSATNSFTVVVNAIHNGPSLPA